MKNCYLHQDKSYRYALRHVSCFNAPMCQKLLSGHIRSYCKKLIVSWTNHIVIHRLRASCCNAPLCHNLLSGQIRSYWRRGVLYVSMRRSVSTNIFGTAILIVPYWIVAPKLSRQISYRA